MPNVQIKNVPEETHRVLRHRAGVAHQSLQEYLRSALIAQANQATLEEVLAAAEASADGEMSFQDVIDVTRADHDRR